MSQVLKSQRLLGRRRRGGSKEHWRPGAGRKATVSSGNGPWIIGGGGVQAAAVELAEQVEPVPGAQDTNAV